MSLRRKVVVVIALGLFVGVLYLGYVWIWTWRHLPESYAAWDTGTLLVEYMKSHEDRWPSSWDDLFTVTNSAAHIPLRGAGSHTNYGLYLRETVAVDWQFDPTRIGESRPVTRSDRSKFEYVWEGAEPNDMIRKYLKTRTNTHAPHSR
jgi:hypothetical protein